MFADRRKRPSDILSLRYDPDTYVVNEISVPESPNEIIELLLQLQDKTSTVERILEVLFERNIDIEVNSSRLVLQGEYSVAQLSDATKSIRTFGVGPCTVLCLYDSNSKSGAMFHIDNAGRENVRIIGPIEDAISDMQRYGAKREDIVAYILSGSDSYSSKDTRASIRDALPTDVRAIGEEELGLSKGIFVLKILFCSPTPSAFDLRN